MAEVKYTLGFPKWVLGENLDKSGPWGDYRLEYEVDATAGPNMMPKGKTIEQFDEWEWPTDTGRISVAFDQQTRTASKVSCYVDAPRAGSFDCATFGFLSAGDDEDELADKIGSPDRVKYDRNSPTKMVDYDKLGLEVALTKRTAYMITRVRPHNLGFWWWLRHGRPDAPRA